MRMTEADREVIVDNAANLIWGVRMYLVGAVEQSRANYPELEPGVEAIVVDSRSLESWLRLLDLATGDLLKLGDAPPSGVLPTIAPRPRSMPSQSQRPDLPPSGQVLRFGRRQPDT